MLTFFEVITEAMQDIESNGYDSEERIKRWINKITSAAKRELGSDVKTTLTLQRSLKATYDRAIKGNALLKVHPGVSIYDINKIKPKLRAELDRRIMASAGLIKLNRQQSIDQTLRRFIGWSTSIPAGGSNVTDTREVKQHIIKSLKTASYEERRLAIDQGHKLTAAINDIVAVDNGAIAAEWHSHWRQAGYNYREDHRERDAKVYAIRGNWAMEKGLMKAAEGYTDEITMVGEECFCRCGYRYIYSLRKLPDNMVTEKGRSTISKRGK